MLQTRPKNNGKVANPQFFRTSFTLVEAIMALLITGIAVAASAALLNTSLSGGELLRNRYTASEIAVSRLEDLRSFPYAELSDMEENAVMVNSRGIPDAEGQYSRTTEVGSEYHHSRSVTVTVRAEWKTGSDPVQVDVSTIIADDAVVQ